MRDRNPVSFLFGVIFPIAIAMAIGLMFYHSFIKPRYFADKQEKLAKMQKAEKVGTLAEAKNEREITFADAEAYIKEALASDDFWKLRMAEIRLRTEIPQDKREQYSDLITNRKMEISQTAGEMRKVASDWESLNPGQKLPEKIISRWDDTAKRDMDKASDFDAMFMLWYDCRLGSEIQKEVEKSYKEKLKEKYRPRTPRRIY